MDDITERKEMKRMKVQRWATASDLRGERMQFRSFNYRSDPMYIPLHNSDK
jgi:hypothetical protein